VRTDPQTLIAVSNQKANDCFRWLLPMQNSKAHHLMRVAGKGSKNNRFVSLNLSV